MEENHQKIQQQSDQGKPDEIQSQGLRLNEICYGRPIERGDGDCFFGKAKKIRKKHKRDIDWIIDNPRPDDDDKDDQKDGSADQPEPECHKFDKPDAKEFHDDGSCGYIFSFQELEAFFSKMAKIRAEKDQTKNQPFLVLLEGARPIDRPGNAPKGRRTLIALIYRYNKDHNKFCIDTDNIPFQDCEPKTFGTFIGTEHPGTIRSTSSTLNKDQDCKIDFSIPNHICEENIDIS